MASKSAVCPPLWKVSCKALRAPPFDDVEERLLLLTPSRQRLDFVVIAFTVYHVVKLGHAAEAAAAKRTGDYTAISALMAKIKKAHAIKFGIAQRSNDARCSRPDTAGSYADVGRPTHHSHGTGRTGRDGWAGTDGRDGTGREGWDGRDGTEQRQKKC